MNLQDKYSALINYARQADVDNLSVREQDGVLNVSGSAPASVKDRIWDIYGQIDPDMRAGDMVLNIQETERKEQVYEIKSGDSLSKIAGKYPGMTWQKIYKANKDTIKTPAKIFPGQKIKLPL